MAYEFVPLWTLADMIEKLLDDANVASDPEARRKARRVVLEAYREFPQRDEWGYFTRSGQVRTQADQSDGSLAFDFTGGAEERLCTLTGATVPSNGEWFTVVIDGVHYPVERAIDSTTFTLPEAQNPGADVAAGTEYRMYRSIYPVPIDYRVGSAPIELNGWAAPMYVSPAQIVDYLWLNNTAQSWQRAYTIRGGGKQYSGMVFEFAPPPSTAVTYQFVYQADPRPIGLIGTSVEYSTGTVSVSGTAATFVGTTLTSRMQGCVLRLTNGATIPTGRGGAYGNDNPYAEQRVIEEVLTTTTATIDQAPDGTFSGVKYTICDPLDIDYHVMLDAFKALCTWKFSEAIKESRDNTADKEKAWRREFGRARAADHRVPVETEEPVPTPIYARLLP